MLRKILFVIAFFTTVTSVIAQEITEKDLVGSWRLVALEVEGIYVDFEKDSISLPEEIIGSMAEGEIIELKKNTTLGLQHFKTLNIDFYEGYTMKAFLEGGMVVDDGPYTIIKNSDTYSIKGTDSDEEFPIDIKDELFYWNFQNNSGGRITTIFERKED
ncbi:MAG: hypothetical protein BM557_04830 [Flavobacterium sp. MedPE-SWcel]|uniref:hypothetical protein n=1 Tax=uncultured Flavobacterium sp. TaxID=165435 RepID=UPI00091A4065|nr:hypothetical protein [uncultured Flavobacterium sp.]OIQ21084.1 MAG: hypothetical protein BM557_04830 [Flavobacterium sp. MedPE-SWcel]